ncbi:MAG: L,D-transpeptidase family protein [Ghiorsea sp.]
MKSFILFTTLLFYWGSASATDLTSQSVLTDRIWQALENTSEDNINAQERSILGATLALEQNNHTKALHMLESPVGQGDPLVNLLKAEAHRRAALEAVSSVGDYAKHKKVSAQMFAAIDLTSDLNEATVRLQAFADKVDGTSGYPLDLLLLNQDVQSVFLVDKARSRMFVYQRDENNQFVRVADEYVVTGAKGGNKIQRGDAKTPNGIYRFTSIRHDQQLRARYGPVVFPIDYPNTLDRLYGKTGDGIWMHGYPENVKRRPPQDTRGCFALPNQNLKQMEPYVIPGKSWVVIGENFQFDAPKKQTALLSSVQTSVETWVKDWQSLDAEAYLSHYHENFRSGKYNLKRWKSYKKRVNGNKSFIDVELSSMNILHDPTVSQDGEIVVADFDQKYRSSNYKDSGKKRLYLARENAQQPWKILIEESLNP